MKLRRIDKMLMYSIGFTLLLLVIRITYTGKTTFLFLIWNLLLACIPWLVAKTFHRRQQPKLLTTMKVIIWLLFLPNAPYLITDIFHCFERPPVPLWFDLLLLVNAAWIGLFMGLLSLKEFEIFLKTRCNIAFKNLTIAGCCMLCAYGIYLGRFLRFNSWDVINQPKTLWLANIHRWTHPFSHLNTWGFTILFGTLLLVCYHSLQSLSSDTH
ncbi:MAG: hypothetical protein RLY16_2570 [Bacteroidota bacterium]|jgi:uncharacterized membrane protein